jgi:AcrR family transcriptional regulator
MTAADGSGARARQKLRTRKDLLQAAARLLREGRTPTFEEIAEAAMVSRATAYRYFPGLDALLLEAELDVAMPTPEAFFAEDGSTDPLARLRRLEETLVAMIAENEPAMRLMLAQSLQRSVDPAADPAAPTRQNRRGPLVAAALAPVRDQFDEAAFDTLGKALVLLLGIEAVVVFKDVLRLPPDEAEQVRNWAMAALVAAARKEAPATRPPVQSTKAPRR